jgi:hypothetical protein
MVGQAVLSVRALDAASHLLTLAAAVPLADLAELETQSPDSQLRRMLEAAMTANFGECVLQLVNKADAETIVEQPIYNFVNHASQGPLSQAKGRVLVANTSAQTNIDRAWQSCAVRASVIVSAFNLGFTTAAVRAAAEGCVTVFEGLDPPLSPVMKTGGYSVASWLQGLDPTLQEMELGADSTRALQGVRTALGIDGTDDVLSGVKLEDNHDDMSYFLQPPSSFS